MNSLDPVWDPPQPLSDMAHSDPRAKLLGDDTESFVDALCRSKLQTDRPWVVSRDNQVFWKAWCYPVLQEVETQLSGSPRVVPWSRIHGVVRHERPTTIRQRAPAPSPRMSCRFAFDFKTMTTPLVGPTTTTSGMQTSRCASLSTESSRDGSPSSCRTTRTRIVNLPFWTTR